MDAENSARDGCMHEGVSVVIPVLNEQASLRRVSIAGGALTAVYAGWRRDPVFLVAQLSGLAIYTRNMILIRRRRQLNTAFTETAKKV